LNELSQFTTVDNLWVLIAAALVFFMQAGFKVLETGLVKQEHRQGIGVKNLMDWVAGCLAFFLIGFGLMFGESLGGTIGSSFFIGEGLEGYSKGFFIFQLAFAGTALTIVSGAMSGRTALFPYFIASSITAVFIYPIFGHWAWGNLLIETNTPWLARLGFMDFAGSTVVHSVGAWIGLVGIYMVGPRLGRYTAKGVIQPVKASDYSYSILGVMILWFGWWGFNGGSTLSFSEDVVSIILNTNLAAAAACFSAYIHVKYVQKSRDTIEKMIGGALTGLVAITACCNVVSPLQSILIGIIAGFIHNISYVFLIEKLKLDDPVGAIPVHGFGGIFGTLSVAIFGDQNLLVHSRLNQLGIQLVGIIVCMAFTMLSAYIVFKVIKYFFGLRLSPREEMEGSVFSDVDTPPEMESLPEQIVNQVSIRISAKSYNLLSVKEYLGLPRPHRLKLIESDSVQYLNDTGSIVPPLQAVRYLSGVLEGERDEVLGEKKMVEDRINPDQQNSIGYMQEVLIGEETGIVSVFPDSFVLQRTSGRVASDFYWHAKERGYKIAVACHCQGDDVSNAFTSALTISLLNEIVGINKVLPPERIIEQLDQKLTAGLWSGDQKQIKGVEIGICVVNPIARKVYYTAAGKDIHLFIKTNNATRRYKGVDIPLGVGEFGTKNYERQVIPIKKSDSVYLFTGGVSNLLNKSGKRIGKTKLMNLLAIKSEHSMLRQKKTLEKTLDDWKGENQPTEDHLMIGFKS